MRQAVFLERDGVLDRLVEREDGLHPPASPAEIEIVDDVPSALAALEAAGFLLVAVTNQPEVAQGAVSQGAVEEVNAWLVDALPLARVFTCYHLPVDNCSCRKPWPGLLFTAAKELGIDLKQSVLVGATWPDLEPGRRAGCRTVRVGPRPLQPAPAPPDHDAYSLGEAVPWILAQRRPG